MLSFLLHYLVFGDSMELYKNIPSLPLGIYLDRLKLPNDILEENGYRELLEILIKHCSPLMRKLSKLK
jgi:hypothetical protein